MPTSFAQRNGRWHRLCNFSISSDADIDLKLNVAPYIVTSIERPLAVLSAALHHVDQAWIDGDIVECGFWRGGNVMLATRVKDQPILLQRLDYATHIMIKR